MKKYFLIVLCILFFGISFGQDSNISWNVTDNMVTPGETKKITQDLGSDNMTDLQKIQSRFCNDEKITKDLKLFVRPWQRKEICIAFANQSDKPISLLFWFSEGTFTKEWGPVCKSDIEQNNFSKHIKNSTITWITIAASGTNIQKFTYVASKNASWNIFGCFGYQIAQQEKIKEGNMFLIVPRKVGYISINIIWSVYRFWRRDDIKDVYTLHKSSILKGIVAILALWIIVSIFQTAKKKEKKHHKKK